ncbi:MAG: polyphosphate kinase 1 [Chitinophagaceae bacterium]|nr:polyphosphate kinase 1 [Chitinophagaceae bacterium]
MFAESISFFNRDISWLSFNERVLMEAASDTVPLMERLKFLSIFSSNLDEFFRVRIPAITALSKIKSKGKKSKQVLKDITEKIQRQQQLFGDILQTEIIPQLKGAGIYLVYNEPIPQVILADTTTYFLNTIASFLKLIPLTANTKVFPENNKIYIVATIKKKEKEQVIFINVPSDHTGRFLKVSKDGTDYIVFIDDIIRNNLPLVFPNHHVTGIYNIKITRDAELDLTDEYIGDLSEKIEQQLTKRDLGTATRFLFPPGMPETLVDKLVDTFSLSDASMMRGGNYHNLKDFMALPVQNPSLFYPYVPPLEYSFKQESSSLFNEISYKDILLHTPYYSYNMVLRFFNEASFDEDVEEIYTTLYRVANDSKIVNALISAAHNGKKVTVFVELKARFDEANNIKWGKRMKAAGIKVIYSIPHLKVHAKIALVKRKKKDESSWFGLLATGNMNENTARFYTDHILLTANDQLLLELERLFQYLGHPKKHEIESKIKFNYLLVSQFNLQKKFLDLIDAEIVNVRKGLPAGITIKLNNLEEKTLIAKLYEASCAGVKISLIVRSVCCLVPGVPGMSENITVKRIVDRYLEHGRVFIFHNQGDEIIFLGSADWMNRNIYSRIEVCFPLFESSLKEEIKQIISIQLRDNVSAVTLDEQLENQFIRDDGEKIRSQQAIHHLCVLSHVE